MGLATHVAFLRSINVGGRRVTGDTLCRAVESTGMTTARSFLASGNVVFDAPVDSATSELEAVIASALESELGYGVPTYIRTGSETRRIAAHDPFADTDTASSRGKLQVALLRDAVSGIDAAAASALAPEGEHLAAAGRELYWLPAAGMSDSDLDLRELERLVGEMTWRTHHTISRIAAKFLSG